MIRNDEKREFIYKLLKHIADNPINEQDCSCAHATDEEVRNFIRLFMVPTHRHNKNYTSYGLKHAAERTIGYIFHGSSSYSYVSNGQFKRIMQEDEFKYSFRPKRDGDRSPNDIYCFRWNKLAETTMYAFGVYGSMNIPPIRTNKTE